MRPHDMVIKEYDVMVIGAGPGGLSAAKAAMEAKKKAEAEAKAAETNAAGEKAAETKE